MVDVQQAVVDDLSAQIDTTVVMMIIRLLYRKVCSQTTIVLSLEVALLRCRSRL